RYKPKHARSGLRTFYLAFQLQIPHRLVFLLAPVMDGRGRRNIPINIARHVVQSLFLSSQKVKSRFLAHNVTLLSFSRPGFSSGD
ncbi:hypothetical protein D6D02_02202, partial [Aureobasidium pullulans]